MTMLATRAAPPPLTRQDKVVANLDLDGAGLEIGPSFAPFLPKKDGYNIKIADHLGTEALKAKYASRGVPIDRIEDVDYDLSGTSLAVAVPRNSFDYVIASHVIEHVPDLITFLAEIWTVLKPGGVLSLVVPDKRFCFDRFRPIAGVGAVIDAHAERRDKPSPGAVAEGLLNYVFNLEDKRIWPVDAPDQTRFRYNHDIAGRAMVRAPSAYMDCHVWTYTPLNLLLLVLDLSALGFFAFAPLPSFNTDPERGEFYLSLEKAEEAARFDRPALCRLAFAEAATPLILANRYFAS